MWWIIGGWIVVAGIILLIINMNSSRISREQEAYECCDDVVSERSKEIFIREDCGGDELSPEEVWIAARSMLRPSKHVVRIRKRKVSHRS